MPLAEEKPGVGTYCCVVCDQRIVLEHVEESLPECPKCGNDEFAKE